jgi:hypothetical protein
MQKENGLTAPNGSERLFVGFYGGFAAAVATQIGSVDGNRLGDERERPCMRLRAMSMSVRYLSPSEYADIFIDESSET